MSDQLHTSAALLPGKNRQYPLDRRLGGPQSQSGRRGEEKILDPTATPNSTPTSSSPQPVAIPTALLPSWHNAWLMKQRENFAFFYIQDMYTSSNCIALPMHRENWFRGEAPTSEMPLNRIPSEASRTLPDSAEPAGRNSVQLLPIRLCKLSLRFIKHHAMKTYRGVEAKLHHSWRRQQMEVSTQLHDPAALPPLKVSPVYIK
jgi:hypothetical protein